MKTAKLMAWLEDFRGKCEDQTAKSAIKSQKFAQKHGKNKKARTK